jgi:hypothetical protein
VYYDYSVASRRGPDNSVRVSIAGTDNSIGFATIHWCQLTVSSTPSQADLDTWLTNFQSAYKTALAGQSGNSVTYAQAKATLFTAGGGVLQSVVSMTGNGTGGTGADVQSSCIVLSWLSSVYWRGGKPRTYLPDPPATSVTSQRNLSAGAITAAVTAGNAFRTAINALTSGAITGTSLGFVSFRSHNADRVPPVFFSVSGCRVHPKLGTQRRRLGKWVV